MKAFKLENEPKIESGLKTPEHYFEDFSSKVMQRLPKQKPKVIPIFQKRKITIMMVAAVLVITLMVPFLINLATKSKELDENTLENYLAYQSNMNQYDLISELDSDDINKIKTPIELEDETIEDFLTTNPNLEHLISE